MSAPPEADECIPYGILPSDHAYPVRIEGCSRCGRAIGADEEPVVLWPHDGHLLWVYCSTCAGSAGYERRAH